MITQAITRRAALGGGLAFASVAGTISVAAGGKTAPSLHGPQRIDAMLVDSSIAMPSRVKSFVEARRQTMRVIDIQLDAATHAELKRVFAESRVIVGVSSGATLFCVERIAWDHGFRLTRRHERPACDLKSDACTQDDLEYLNGAHPTAMRSATHGYRPSRADAMLHAWTMQKSARAYFSQDQREA